jgi:hypothetical protein
MSAGGSVEKKYLTGSGVVRDAILRQQSAQVPAISPTFIDLIVSCT